MTSFASEHLFSWNQMLWRSKAAVSTDKQSSPGWELPDLKEKMTSVRTRVQVYAAIYQE